MRFLKNLYQHARRRLLGDGEINFRGGGIVNLIDVGSAGELPFPWKENAGKIQHLLKFEPRDQSRQTPYTVALDPALWEGNSEKDLYIYKGFGGTGSSLFRQNHEYVAENFADLRRRGPKNLADTWFERSELDRVEKISCRRLDDVLLELNQPFPYHFLKVDAQGAEYEILRGAEKFLRQSCLGMHLELFTLPLYKGIRLLSEVEAYLGNLDFELVKKFPPHGSFDSQNDCLFVKRGVCNKISEEILKVYDV